MIARLLVFCALFVCLARAQNCADTTAYPISEFCLRTGLTSTPASCPVVGLFVEVAQALQPPTCKANAVQGAGLAAPPSTDLEGVVLPAYLPDVRRGLNGLPETLDWQAFTNAEGSTYFWYFRNILTLQNWSPCPDGTALPLPEGWSLVGTYKLPPSTVPGDNGAQLPFAALIKPDADRYDSCKKYYAAATATAHTAGLRRGGGYSHDNYYSHESEHNYYSHHEDYHNRYNDRYDNNHYDNNNDYGCQGAPDLVLLIRGSLTLQDYAADLSYQQVNGGAYGPGQVSAGFSTAAEQLWTTGGLGAAIQSEINKGARSITLSGYSLGAAVSSLLAVRIEALLRTQAYGGSYGGYSHGPGAVTVVNFGPPNAGNSIWAANFNKRINARNIGFQGDLIPTVPCASQMIDCTNPLANPPVFFQYTRTGGNIVFPAASMPFNNAPFNPWQDFATFSAASLCDKQATAARVIATHVCAYLCLTSPGVGATNNLCWINPLAPAPTGASSCFGPPV